MKGQLPHCVCLPAARQLATLLALWCVVTHHAVATTQEPAGSEVPATNATFSADLSLGRETNHVPEVTWLDAEPYVLIGPNQRVTVPVWRTSVMGSVDMPLSGFQRVSVNWRLDQQRSGSGNLLGYRLMTVDARWGTEVAGIPVSVGPGVQELWVSGSRFRRTASLDADATLQADPQGIWSVFASVGAYRHPGELRDLDATAWSVSTLKRWTADLPGVDALELDMGMRGERNRQQIAGLSSRGVHVRSGVEHSVGDWSLSWGVTWQTTRYNGAVLDTGPSRRDAFVSWDASASLPLGAGWQIRVSTTSASNRANLPMFFQKSRGWALSLGYTSP